MNMKKETEDIWRNNENFPKLRLDTKSQMQETQNIEQDKYQNINN